MFSRALRLPVRSALYASVVLSVAVAGAAIPAVEAAAAPAKPPAATKAVEQRPDAVSAMLTARSQGKRVEDVSARTATSRTWANPDGTWTQDSHVGVQRFRGADGKWVEVDLDLAKSAEGVAPRSHPLGLQLPGKGRGQWVSVDEGKGRTVRMGFPQNLTEPTVTGTRATYPAIEPGVDMVIEVLRTGFEQFFVLNERPASGAAVSWDLPLQTKGLTARPAADGGVEFADSKSNVISRIPAAYAWDAQVDKITDEHTNISPVTLKVAQKSPGQAVLTVTPDPAWLAAESTQFPVTIDPTYAAATRTTTFDTYVHEGYSTGQSASTELKLGYDGAGHLARSFLEFQLGTLKGKTITAASLKLHATHSWSCTAKYWETWSVTGDATTSTVWSNQPEWTVKQHSANQTKGYSSACPDGEVSISALNLVRNWSASSATTNRLGIRAGFEGNDPETWKKFASSETATDPYVSITYNRAPATASAPAVAPAASYNAALYTSDTTPALSSRASDADGNTVNVTFEVHSSTTTSASTLKATCTTAYVAASTTATCSPATALSDNATYYVRAKANDSMEYGAWSSWTAFKMAAAAPAAPAISCPAPYSNGSWNDDAPTADVTCTVTATGTGTNAPGFIKYAVDGGAAKQVQITQSSDPAVAKSTVTVSKNRGGHKISAWAISPSGKTSAEKQYSFGYGKTAVSSPAVNPVPVTTSTINVVADSPPTPAGTTATSELKWRLASSGADDSTGWNTAKSLTVAADATTGGLKVTGTWDTMSADLDAANGNIALDDRVPTNLELQVCTTYTSGSQCTWNSQPLRVLRVPHAFGDGFPEADVGPGQVALWTGEFTTSATDVIAPGYTGDLSLSRTHSTFAGAPTAASDVFGPGWSAALDGSDAGLAGYQLLDNTLVDGTVLLVADDAPPLVFAPPTWARRAGSNMATGTWQAVEDDTADAGVKAVVTGSGTATTFALTDPDGVTTTFKVTTAATSSAAADFAPLAVSEPGAGTTSYTRDAQGRVTRILAPIPAGMTATDCPGTGTLAPGCRALDITYAAATTATSTTPGDIAGQVQKVTLNIFNPAKSGGAGMDAITVATYAYGSDKRLRSVTDPRTGLATTYAYNAAGDLDSITEPGLTPYTLEYAGSPAKLARVKRDNPGAAGTTTLATVLYDVPTSGAGLPDLSATGVDYWGQTSAPAWAAAVFGPDKPVTTRVPAEVDSGDWSYATVYATDARGYTTNTATYGAGAWLPTWTEYNAAGYPIRELDEGDIAAVTAGNQPAGQAGTLTVYNTASNGPAATAVGSVVTDTYGPARSTTLKNGAVVVARPHSAYVYDEGAPNGGINPDTDHGWALPTTVKTGPVAPDDYTELEAPEVTKTTYGATVESWKLGAPTATTQVIDGGAADIVRVTGYDGAGRVTEQRQPTSDGADAGTRKSVYYTADANAADAACGGKPEWAGALCTTFYAGQASGQDLVRSRVTGYDAYLAPTTVVESANGATRTTTSTYDSASRPLKTTITASGITGSAAVNGSETVYSATTGLPTEEWATTPNGARTGAPVKTGYDAWGRATTYEPTAGQVTTTTYDSAGRIATVADPKGTQTYGYGTDAAGQTDRRGLPTSITVTGGPGGTSLTSTGAYGADGTLILQKLPGGITQELQVDVAGEPTSLEYRGQVTTDNGDGTTTVEPDAGWLGWSLNNDIDGRVRREWTPVGAAFSGGLEGSAAAAAYDRSYRYDTAGRLTRVDDRTGSPGAAVDETTGAPLQEACQTRTYGFDKNGNRLTLQRTPGEADGTCNAPGATGSTTKTWNYDAGDRLTGGYDYDALGRATTLPAVDAPVTGAGDIALGYFDADAIASITQNGTRTNFTLDEVGRRSIEAIGPIGQSATRTTTRFYTDESDNPGWVTVTDAAGTATTRYAGSLGGDLGLTLTSPAGGGAVDAELALADPHGDVVATTRVPASGAATGITGWTDHDEYGNPLTGPDSGALTDGVGYGWLGANERSTLDTGLILMGARIYNRVTGQFTATDPMFGGGATAYAYPTDPINGFDLDGNSWISKKWNKAKRFYKKHKKAINLAVTVASFAVPGAAAARGAYMAYRGYRAVRAARKSGSILGYTRHGLNRAIGAGGRDTRSVSVRAIRDTVRSPQSVERQGSVWRRTHKYRGKDAVVVLNRKRHVITTWPKGSRGRRGY